MWRMFLQNFDTEKVSEVATYVAAAASVMLWGFSISELAVMVSTGLAAGSFGVHVWAVIRRDRRETRRDAREDAALNGDRDNET